MGFETKAVTLLGYTTIESNGAPATGGAAGGITIGTILGNVSNNVELDANGGAYPVDAGGAGGFIGVCGVTVDNSGNLSAIGGDGENGGNGGSIAVGSLTPPSTQTGTANVSGGTSNPGVDGSVLGGSYTLDTIFPLPVTEGPA